MLTAQDTRTHRPSLDAARETSPAAVAATGSPAAPKAPRTFKIVDLATGAVLASAADARTAVDVLTGIDSMFGVAVYVWHAPAHAWRRLTVGEQRTLWGFRGR